MANCPHCGEPMKARRSVIDSLGGFLTVFALLIPILVKKIGDQFWQDGRGNLLAILTAFAFLIFMIILYVLARRRARVCETCDSQVSG